MPARQSKSSKEQGLRTQRLNMGPFLVLSRNSRIGSQLPSQARSEARWCDEGKSWTTRRLCAGRHVRAKLYLNDALRKIGRLIAIAFYFIQGLGFESFEKLGFLL